MHPARQQHATCLQPGAHLRADEGPLRRRPAEHAAGVGVYVLHEHGVLAYGGADVSALLEEGQGRTLTDLPVGHNHHAAPAYRSGESVVSG